MKAIGNIFLTWRKGRGSKRIAIGVIKNNLTDGVRFNYISENVAEAKKLGFVNYEGFPEIDKVYSENVLEKFGQRLIQSDRNDLRGFYDFWGVDVKHKNNKYYMLAHTQGLLPTDNFEFLADFNPIKGLTFISEITNLKNAQIPSDIIKIGDILIYKLEKDNEYDSFAVKLFKNDYYLGHVKLIHNKVFHKSKYPLNVIVHSIEKNGVLNKVFIKITT